MTTDNEQPWDNATPLPDTGWIPKLGYGMWKGVKVNSEEYIDHVESQLSALQERLRETEAERDETKRIALLDREALVAERVFRMQRLKEERDESDRVILKVINERKAEKSRAATAESKLTTANARNLDLQAQVVARIQERDAAERALGAHARRCNVCGAIATNLIRSEDGDELFLVCGEHAKGFNTEMLLPNAAETYLVESARQPAADQDNEVTQS